MKCLSKFLTKAIILTLSGLSLALLLACLIVTIFLSNKKSEIEHTIARLLNENVSIGQIIYLPPADIILKDISFAQDLKNDKFRILSIKYANLTFSPISLLSKKGFIVTNVQLNSSKVNYLRLQRYVKKNYASLTKLYKYLYQEHPLRLCLKNASINLLDKDNGTLTISLDSLIEVDAFELSTTGSITFPDSHSKTSTAKTEARKVLYNFKGFFSKNGLVIEEVELAHPRCTIKAWGGLENRTLRLRGFSLSSDSSITSFSCFLKMGLEKLLITECAFALNNVPIHLSGEVSFDPFIATVALSSNNSRALLEKLTLDFTDETSLRAHCQKAKLSLLYNDALLTLEPKDINCKLNLSNNAPALLEFTSRFYDGLLEGTVRFDQTQASSRCTVDLRINDARLKNHELISQSDPQIDGILESNIHYQSYPQSQINGDILIRNGYLGNSPFFKKIADFFTMPSINKVSFDTLSLRFLSDGKNLELDGLSIVSKDVGINGFFRLFEDDLISSKISVTLSKRLLETSSKLTSLLKHIGEKSKQINLDFQFSGNINTINFQWLDSKFKTKLQDSIPNFMLKLIESKIEKSISAGSLEL